MKKFFPIYDIKEIDRQTTVFQGIEYIQLIERAARALCDWIMTHYTRRRVVILAGPGNNGADGLQLGLLLTEKEWMVDIHAYEGMKGHRSECNEECCRRMENAGVLYDVNNAEPELPQGCLVVDALFGTGMKREMEGPTCDVTRYINASKVDVMSIDIPSGLGSEDSYEEMESRTVMRANHTVTFQFPKMAFFIPELRVYIGSWHVVDIKLASRAILDAPTFMYYSDDMEAGKLVRPRDRFAHKGTMGHAVLFAGSRGMAGAAILASEACLRSGVGLLTTVTSGDAYLALQSRLPEAMTLVSDGESDHITWDGRMEMSKASAVGIGPGLSRLPGCTELLGQVIRAYGGRRRMVIDADGLYALRPLLDQGLDIPEGTILTPHPIELDRLTEPHTTHVQRIEAACLLAIRYQCVVVLKGAFTMTALPDGRRIFNTTGNSGMATAGSGDVLTGIILGLLTQGYNPEDAATLGVALHAAAGDIAAEEMGQESMLAGDIVRCIGKAYKRITNSVK